MPKTASGWRLDDRVPAAYGARHAARFHLEGQHDQEDHGNWADGSASADDPGREASFAARSGPALRATQAREIGTRKLAELDKVLVHGKPLEWRTNPTDHRLTDEQRAEGERNTRAAVSMVVREIREQQSHEHHQGIAQKSEHWYNKSTQDAVDVLAKEIPELRADTPEGRALLILHAGIMSQNMTPRAAFGQAVRAQLDYYAKGEQFQPVNSADGKGWGYSEIGRSLDGLNKLRADLGGDTQAMLKWLTTEHKLSDLWAANEKYRGVGRLSMAKLGALKRKDELMPGSLIFGRKLGNFIANLNGRDTEATVDLWGARHHARLFNLPKPTSARVSHSIGDSMRRIYSDAAQQLGMSTSAAQAAAWNYESRLYSDLGVFQNGNAGTFRDAAVKVATAYKKKGRDFAREEEPEGADDDTVMQDILAMSEEELQQERLAMAWLAVVLGVAEPEEMQRADFHLEGQHDQELHGNWADGGSTPGEKRERSDVELMQATLATGGATYHPITKNSPRLGVDDVYVVSPYKEREQVLSVAELTPAKLHDYILRNLDKMSEGAYFGAWLNRENGKVYLDTVIVEPDRTKALDIGRQHRQLAIFGFKGIEEIPTGYVESDGEHEVPKTS